MSSTRFLGLDISAKSTGVTILDRDDLTGRLSLVYVTHIAIPSSVGKIKLTDGERLSTLRSSLWEILDRFNPEVFVKEGQGANMSKFRSVSLVSKATGVCEEVCQSWWGDVSSSPLEIYAYPPMTIKKEITGFGGVDKEIARKYGTGTKANYMKKKPVIDEMIKMFGSDDYSFVLRKLKGDVEKVPYFNDDETDSSAVIITHFKKKGIDYHV